MTPGASSAQLRSGLGIMLAAALTAWRRHRWASLWIAAQYARFGTLRRMSLGCLSADFPRDIPVWHSDAARGPSTPSFDHLVGAGEQGRRHLEAERVGGFQIDGQVELGGQRDRQVGGLT